MYHTKINALKIYVLVLFVLFGTLTTPISVFAHNVSDADAALIASDVSFTQKLFDFFVLGAKHMVTGYDHLLFILGIVFLLTKFKDIVKFVSYFTLGHSITLIVATLFGIEFNYFLIDAVIGLSVAYKGYDNLYGIKKLIPPAPDTKTIIFLFGLVHGFGLSTRLQALPLPDRNLLTYILSFNIGVEAGQLLGLAVFLFILNRFRHTSNFQTFKLLANKGLMLAGIFLFAMHLTSAVRSWYG